MSNTQTIAHVTQALSKKLSALIGTNCTIHRPGTADVTKNGVNIYLYQVTPNPAWRSSDLPTRSRDGQTILQRPRIALDLHYLLSFHDDTFGFNSQHYMGQVVSYLHANPILTRDVIKDALIGAPLGLTDSGLGDEKESVKFTPTMLSVEELSRLWSVLFQTPHVLSMAYQASVIFIDWPITPIVAPLVKTRHVFPTTFRQPFIEKLVSATGPESFFTPDTPLVIRGQQFGDGVKVRFGGQRTDVEPEIRGENELNVDFPALLPAGPATVQVVWPLDMVGAAGPHPKVVAESNLVPFMLSPVINGTPTVAPTGISPGTGTITIDCQPPVNRQQRVLLLLNQSDPAPATNAKFYSFEFQDGKEPVDDPPAPTSTQLKIPFQNVLPGKYTVRLQVNGAQSQLQRDPTPGPTIGQYNQPQVTIS